MNVNICNFAIFGLIFMTFSPKCRAKSLGILFTILGTVCSFLNWEEADIKPQVRPNKIPVLVYQ